MNDLPEQNDPSPEMVSAIGVPAKAILSPRKLTTMFASAYIGTYISTLPIAILFVLAFSSIQNFNAVVDFLKHPLIPVVFILPAAAGIVLNRKLRDSWIGIGSSIGLVFWGMMFCLARAGDEDRRTSGWFADAYLEIGVFFGFLCIGIPMLIILFSMILRQLITPSEEAYYSHNKKIVRVITISHGIICGTLGLTIIALIIGLLLYMS